MVTIRWLFLNLNNFFQNNSFLTYRFCKEKSLWGMFTYMYFISKPYPYSFHIKLWSLSGILPEIGSENEN